MRRENEPLALTLSPFGGEREFKRLRSSPGCAVRHPLLAQRGEGRGEELEFFPAAGCQFEFSAKTIQPIAKMLREELEKL